jgi:hypothetical protein
MMQRDCGWKAVERFNSFEAFDSVKQSIGQQVASGLAKEVKVRKPYSGLETLDEHWYKCGESGEIWRLIAPDPPFPGVFQPV